MRDDTIEVGETHAVMRCASGAQRVAKIIDKKIDPESGQVVLVLLDRIVHDRYQSKISGWNVSGCFVTQLSRGTKS